LISYFANSNSVHMLLSHLKSVFTA